MILMMELNDANAAGLIAAAQQVSHLADGMADGMVVATAGAARGLYPKLLADAPTPIWPGLKFNTSPDRPIWSAEAWERYLELAEQQGQEWLAAAHAAGRIGPPEYWVLDWETVLEQVPLDKWGSVIAQVAEFRARIAALAANVLIWPGVINMGAPRGPYHRQAAGLLSAAGCVMLDATAASFARLSGISGADRARIGTSIIYRKGGIRRLWKSNCDTAVGGYEHWDPATLLRCLALGIPAADEQVVVWIAAARWVETVQAMRAVWDELGSPTLSPRQSGVAGGIDSPPLAEFTNCTDEAGNQTP